MNDEKKLPTATTTIVQEKSFTVSRLLTVEETAQMLGVKKGFLDKRRTKSRRHESIPYHEIGGSIRYALHDVLAYIAATRRTPPQK